MFNQDRIDHLENRVVQQEFALKALEKSAAKHEETDTLRFNALKESIDSLQSSVESNSLRVIVRDNIKWIVVTVLALAGGTSGITKLIDAIIPLLSK